MALVAVFALAFGWEILRARRRRAGLCPDCGRPPDAMLGDPYGTPICGSCVKAEKRASRAAVYLFVGLLASVLAMAAVGTAEDIRRGYKFGLKDLPSLAFFIIALGPFVALIGLSWRHLKAAQKARMEEHVSGERTAPPGGPTTR